MSETLGAGRELDALVAEKVMGWPAPEYITDEQFDPARPIIAWRTCHRTHGEFDPCEDAWTCGSHKFYYAPHYSTDIAAAWEVVERLRTRGKAVLVIAGHEQNLCAAVVVVDGFAAPFPVAELPSHPEYTEDGVRAMAPTAPLAICLAALKAVASPTEEGRP